MVSKVLMVCVGNVCRSPIAEALLNQYFKSNNIQANCNSAGVSALVDHIPDDHAITVMESRGIDLTSHRGQQISNDLITNHDLILVMETEQLQFLKKNYPVSVGRTHLIGKWQNMEIPDPYQKPLAAFEQTVEKLKLCLKDWEQRLWTGGTA